MKSQKMITFGLIAPLCFFCSLASQAQFNKLDSLNNYLLKVYYSKGHDDRAKQVALLSQNALVYLDKLLSFTPNVTLLILSPADWSDYTKFPVYGMPHYSNSKTLVVAAEDNAFWKGFIPPMEQLPPSLADQIKKVYSINGSLSMQPFFDLLALHELGHAYHQQASLNVQRKWMGELFCNILLHTYIAENEPERLPALSVFPNMVVAAGTTGYSFTTLEQFETNYNEIGSKHPKNYGWYQCRLHVAAREIYDEGGKAILAKLWLALQSPKNKDDKVLAEQLSTKVHDAVGNVMRKW